MSYQYLINSYQNVLPISYQFLPISYQCLTNICAAIVGIVEPLPYFAVVFSTDEIALAVFLSVAVTFMIDRDENDEDGSDDHGQLRQEKK